MGRGSLSHQHQQLLSRFDSVTKRDSPKLISNVHLKKLDTLFNRFQDWGEDIGVHDGALAILEKSGHNFRKPIVKSFDGIYIRLRVVGNLLKDNEKIGGERGEEARATVARISNDIEALEQQAPAIKAFLKKKSGQDSALATPERDGDSDERRRQVSSSTSNTGQVSNWTTTTAETRDGPKSSPFSPKTPRAQIIPPFAGTNASNSASPHTRLGWEDEWDREFVVRALSASQSRVSFTAASDEEEDHFVPRKMDFSKAASGGTTSSAVDSARRNPMNTTWIEDTSSTFKEDDSQEAVKAGAGVSKFSQSSPESDQTKDWEGDNEQFRKYIGLKLTALEQRNKSLSRKVEELEKRGPSEEERRALIEEYVRKKGEEEMWEKSIREAAVEQYKEQLRIESEKEEERKATLMREARLIEERAQKEMTEIYQQTGRQIRQAERRHQDEVDEIQQRLNSELLGIERRIHEQIESSVWRMPPKFGDTAEKGKAPRVSFEPRDQTPKHQSEENTKDIMEKSHSLQVPSNRLSGGSGADGRLSNASQIAPETPVLASFPADVMNRNLEGRQVSAEYGPIAAVIPWENKENRPPDMETPPSSDKRPSRTASRFRRLAKTLRLRTVNHNDINVVKVPKRSKGSPSKLDADGKRRVSKGSFMSRRRRASSMKQQQQQRRTSQEPTAISERSDESQPIDTTTPVRPSLPTGDKQAASYSPQIPSPCPAGRQDQPAPVQSNQTTDDETTPPRHPPFSFQLSLPPGKDPNLFTRQLPAQPLKSHQTKTTRVLKNHISPDTLTYYGLPWEWDRVSGTKNPKRKQQNHRPPSPQQPSTNPARESPESKFSSISSTSSTSKSTNVTAAKKRNTSRNPFFKTPPPPSTTTAATTQPAAHPDKYWPVLTNLLFARPPAR